MINRDGVLFCNELGRRDYVNCVIWKNKVLFRFCLNNAAAQEIIWHSRLHYTGRGVMYYYASGEALAQDMGCKVQRLVDALEQHHVAARKREENPTGRGMKLTESTGLGRSFSTTLFLASPRKRYLL